MRAGGLYDSPRGMLKRAIGYGVEMTRGFMDTSYAHQAMKDYGSYLGGSGINLRIDHASRWLDDNAGSFSAISIRPGEDWY